MKISQETIITVLTNIVGLCVMIFGLSSDVASTIQNAIPTIVGGAMSLVSVVTYLYNLRKGKEAVIQAIASQSGEERQARGVEILKVAKDINLI